MIKDVLEGGHCNVKKFDVAEGGLKEDIFKQDIAEGGGDVVMSKREMS